MQFSFYWWFLVDSNTCYLLTNGNHGNLSLVHTQRHHTTVHEILITWALALGMKLVIQFISYH